MSGNLQLIKGQGKVVPIVIPNPPPGTDLIFPVPVNHRWEILGLEFVLNTVVGGSARSLTLSIVQDTITIFTIQTKQAIIGNQTRKLSFSQGNQTYQESTGTYPNEDQNYNFPFMLLDRKGGTLGDTFIQTITTDFNAADTYTDGLLLVRQWIL